MPPRKEPHTDPVKNNILLIRKALGLSQRRAEIQCGLPKGTVAQIEYGSRLPSVPTLRRLKDGFNCSYDALLDPDLAREYAEAAGNNE